MTAATYDDEVAAGALVVDIRPVEQRERDGELAGALVIDRNVLEWRLDLGTSTHAVPEADHDARVVVAPATRGTPPRWPRPRSSGSAYAGRPISRAATRHC